MPKIGDIVFAKTFDVYSEESTVRPGIITRVFTEEDGEWAKDREIVSLTLFGANTIEHVDMDKGTTDDAGDWVAGGWSESPDGPSSSNDAFASGGPGGATDPNPATTPDPGTFGIGAVGDSAANPDTNPGATSGANTGTVGDGSDAAPVTQPT